MIKINLNPNSKQLNLANVGGFDLTKIKVIPFVIALVFYFAVPDMVVTPMLQEELQARQSEFNKLENERKKLKQKVAQSAALEKQIRELKAQEENLGKKLTAVKQAISLKRNPSNLLLYISKNIPEELWIKELTIDNQTMNIKGEALSYTSVGSFVTNLRSSIFIKDANIKSTNSTVRASDKKRIENFEVQFDIARFE